MTGMTRKPGMKWLTLSFVILIALSLTGCSLDPNSPETSAPLDAEETQSAGTAPEAGATSVPATALPELEDELDILGLILRMDPSEINRIKSHIDEYVTRNDAIGYHANLYMAKKMEAEEQDASPFYEKAYSLYETDGVMLKLADSYRKKGDLSAALAAYRELLPNETALTEMLEIDLSPVLIGEILLEKGLGNAAVLFLEIELQKESRAAQSAQLSRLHAMSMAQSGRYTEAVPLLAKLEVPVSGESGAATTDLITALANPKAIVTDPNAAFWYARCLEAVEQGKQAMALYRRLGPMGGERLGLLLEKGGRLKESAQAFMLSGKPSVVWRGTQIAEELGETEMALEAYLRLTEDKSKEAAAYLDDAAYRAYILGRRLGQQDNQDKLLKELSAHPAWMARTGEDPVWEPFTETPVENPEYLAKTEKYEKMGLDEIAELEYAIGIRETTPAEKLALGKWNLERGDIYRSSIWGARALTEVNDRLAYELAYPKVFEEFVMKSAKEFDLEPFLIWGLIRQESQYQPQVLSRVGAVGLMQIMPATGADIAVKLGVSKEDMNLQDPETNIRFGAYYLRSMLKQFDGNVDMALAAYNGGGGNVRRWKKSGIMKKAEDFPTAITFFETREYITKVMDGCLTYRWMDTVKEN